jgi:uncharacterized repeat protein (TIGR03803 family)
MRRLLLLFVLCVLTAWGSVSRGQTITKLYDFHGTSDGAFPVGFLVQGTDEDYYGETDEGGANGNGTIFKFTPQGTLTTLYQFDNNLSTDGRWPLGGLLQGADGDFYGTASYGGAYGGGIVFRITPDGALTRLYNFCAHQPCSDGAHPSAGLVQGADGNFYGTTQCGNYACTDLNGTVFRISAQGVLTTLHKFNGSDGANLTARLLLAGDGNFYGTTQAGGYVGGVHCSPNGCGLIFRITPQGAFSTLHIFCAGDSSCPDGNDPADGLVQGNDGYLYGTTAFGGAASAGTIYRTNLAGALTTLYSFGAGFLNSQPGLLMQALDGNFYGTVEFGPTYAGQLFRVTTTGTFTAIYTFCSQNGCSDGGVPSGALMVGDDGWVYGTTEAGGSTHQGTVYKFDPGFYPLSIRKTGSGTVISGDNHINCGKLCSHGYPRGAQMGLTAIPAPGFTFSEWTGCDNPHGAFCVVKMSSGRPVTATFTAAQVTLTSLVFKPNSVKGGQLSIATLSLSDPAPDGGVGVSLTSDHPSVAYVPSSVVVPGGKSSVVFAVRTVPVKANTAVNITATAGSSQTGAVLMVTTGFNSNQSGGQTVGSANQPGAQTVGSANQAGGPTAGSSNQTGAGVSTPPTKNAGDSSQPATQPPTNGGSSSQTPIQTGTSSAGATSNSIAPASKPSVSRGPEKYNPRQYAEE